MINHRCGKKVIIWNLHTAPYDDVWKLQQKLFNLQVQESISDVLLLTEHNHVYTIGKSGNDKHLLSDNDELRKRSTEVFYVDRGGDITYHGPGQLVGYPILNLNNYYLDIHRYLRDLEEVLIRTLNDFGINGNRENEFTGVWVGNEKIAAIGIKVSKWITMHGFALNVNTDLSYFDRIIPCGIFHRGVTSMQRILGNSISLQDVSDRVSYHFGCVFNAQIVKYSKNEIMKSIIFEEKVECQQ